MKLHALQLTQLEVSSRSKGSDDMPIVRVSRIGGPLHQIMARVTFTERERACLAALVGIA